MWEWVNLDIVAGIPVDATQACERVLPVNIHRAGATDTLPAGAAESEGGVDLVLDFDERIQNLGPRVGEGTSGAKGTYHGSRLVEINGVGLQCRLLVRLIRVLCRLSHSQQDFRDEASTSTDPTINLELLV